MFQQAQLEKRKKEFSNYHFVIGHGFIWMKIILADQIHFLVKDSQCRKRTLGQDFEVLAAITTNLTTVLSYGFGQVTSPL